MAQATLTGPLAGAVLALLGLVLLVAPASSLYRKNRSVIRRRSSGPPVPLWATIFFRVLGALLLAFAGVLIWPAVQ